MALKSVELFAGAGGLAMGVSLAGFESVGVVEWDRWACDTVRINQERGHPLVNGWPLFEGDVRAWNQLDSTSSLSGRVDLLAGGPPCQPFSMGGKHMAYDDARDMFPATVCAIRTLKPRAFIVENVKGLTRPAFSNYLEYIQDQLRFPEIAKAPNESWRDHSVRLQSAKTSVETSGQLSYRLHKTLVNAADHGVPQRRERVFLVGFRSDIDAQWSFPSATHSLNALLHDQWVTGHYWERHRVAKKQRPSPPETLAKTIAELRALGFALTRQPWLTVRDAIAGLSEPTAKGCSAHLNHKLQHGARTYPGHTGSPIDLPAKTLKAGDHGVPGGENMLVRLDGSVRYFTIREAARLQTFPDGYELHGSWSEAMRQLGNAVPVRLGQVVARSVATQLLLADERRLVTSSRQKRVPLHEHV